MSQSQLVIMIAAAIAFVAFMLLAYYANNYSLNRIKSRTVGNGQHGTAKWANKGEIKKAGRAFTIALKLLNKRYNH